MRSIRRLAALAVLLLCMLFPATALAYNPLGDACSSGGSSSACGASASNPIYGSGGVLEKITVVLALFGGIAAVIIIIVAGLQIVTAGGDSQKVEGARKAIIGALIGIIIILAAAGIITFVVSKV